MDPRPVDRGIGIKPVLAVGDEDRARFLFQEVLDEISGIGKLIVRPHREPVKKPGCPEHLRAFVRPALARNEKVSKAN